MSEPDGKPGGNGACIHCGEQIPFRWMGTFHCREDHNLDGLRWEAISLDWR